MKECPLEGAAIISEQTVKKGGEIIGNPGCNVTTLPLDIPLSFSRFF